MENYLRVNKYDIILGVCHSLLLKLLLQNVFRVYVSILYCCTSVRTLKSLNITVGILGSVLITT